MRTPAEIYSDAFLSGLGGAIRVTAEEMAELKRPAFDIILRCRSCGVSWERDKPERHIMGCEMIKPTPGATT